MHAAKLEFLGPMLLLHQNLNLTYFLGSDGSTANPKKEIR
jgi:hypothetical protein